MNRWKGQGSECVLAKRRTNSFAMAKLGTRSVSLPTFRLAYKCHPKVEKNYFNGRNLWHCRYCRTVTVIRLHPTRVSRCGGAFSIVVFGGRTKKTGGNRIPLHCISPRWTEAVTVASKDPFVTRDLTENKNVPRHNTDSGSHNPNRNRQTPQRQEGRRGRQRETYTPTHLYQ